MKRRNFMAYEYEYELMRTKYENKTGPALCSDNLRDFNSYYEPLYKMQNSNIFNWGIIEGFKVTVAGEKELQLDHGAGIDKDGNLILLYLEAVIGVNPDEEYNRVSVPVRLSTNDLKENAYVTVTFNEPDSDKDCWKHIPWVRLEKISSYGENDGHALILATVTINNNGKITTINGNDRVFIKTSLGNITLKRGSQSITSNLIGNPIEDKVQGDIRALLPSEGSGLKISVPEATDNILFARKNSNNFAKLEVKADTFVVNNSIRGEVLTVDTKDAKLYVGAKGNDGDLFVKDSADRNVIHLNGYEAKLYLGKEGKAGKLSIFDTTGNESVIISGDTGNLSVNGDIRINDKDLWLRGSTDKNHGIGWYGLGKLFEYTNLDGPVLFGFSGGALGTTTSGQRIALQWDSQRNVRIGGNVRIDGSHTYLSGYTSEGNGYPTIQTHHVIGPSGSEALSLEITWEGGHILSKNVIIGDDWGFFSKQKHFLINHPLDLENKYLIHSTLEGPEIAVFYRGEAQLSNGEAIISLPDYFEALTRKENRTVLLTPKFSDDAPISMLAASEVKDGTFTVKMIDSKNPSQKFYWEVKAVRADVEKLEVERTNTSVK